RAPHSHGKRCCPRWNPSPILQHRHRGLHDLENRLRLLLASVGSRRRSTIGRMVPRVTTRRRELRVVQVSFHQNPELPDGEALLQAYPTVATVPAALARLGLDVSVVQAA